MNDRPQRILGFRESQVLQLVTADLATRGRVRSYEAIATALGMGGRNYVCNVIGRLERRGIIRRVREAGNLRIEAPSREYPATAASARMSS